MKGFPDLKFWAAPFRWSAAVLLVFGLASGRAQEFRWESVGARGGCSANDTIHTFYQAEAFSNWLLPWGLNFGEAWRLDTRLDLSAGGMGNTYGDVFVGTIGPSVILKRAAFPISLEAGSSPTVISHFDFESKDFGLPFQFTSHLGLNVDVGQHLRLGYRFQHMSNAGLGSPNPGLNTHLFGVSYLF